MVELGSKGPFGQSFDNSVFIIPGLILVAAMVFVGLKLRNSILEKEQKELERRQKKEEKKVKKTK